VLYELLALRHPFNANDMKSLMHRILRLQYDPAPLCYSAELRGLVGKLLVKDPNQRMQLSEVLEQPVIRNRILLWLKGGILPSLYVNSLVRNKLLPPSILGELPPERSTATHLPSLSATNGDQPPSYIPTPPANPPAYQKYLSGMQADPKLKPKPHRLSDALAGGHTAPGMDPPPRHEPYPSRVSEAPAGIPYAPKLPSMRAHVPEANPRNNNFLPALPQASRPGPLGPVRVQPSVRPLPYVPSQGRPTDVQSAIQRAAQGRAYNRYGR
jgi:serine/threonine protein kinase